MKLRKRQRKEMSVFYKDHAWGWRPPKKLRKIKYTDEEIEFLYNLRQVYIEAGRKRMVARGLWQYANIDEPEYALHQERLKKWEQERKTI